MTAQRYQAIFDWFRARPAALRALGYAQKISVLGVYLVYGAVLAVTLWQRSGQFWRVLAVPAAVYVLGTLLRAAINRPRPYEALNFTPLFPKDTKGQSMPSRHCFSAAAIVAAGQKARQAGLALSVTAISGLGSRELLRDHAVDTARALSAMKPEYIGLLTLMVEPGTPLEQWVREGSFRVLGPAEILQETALLLDHIDSEGSVFRMNHASNYLTLKGTLNRDLPALRQQVQEGLMGHGLRPESWRAL